jgi:hypothetical protein
VGGIGGGTTERYYADAAVQIRKGRLRTTGEILDAINPIVPNDDEFRANFESASVYRISAGRYLLLALERDASGAADAAAVSPSERIAYAAEAILPRGADPVDWPGWTASEISAFSRRLGNFALIPSGGRLTGLSWRERREILGASGARTSEVPARAEVWLPEMVRQRQSEFSERAAQIWPLLP